MMSPTVITIETIGLMRVSAHDGTNLTPKGARVRAVLAVIALSPDKIIARRRLESLFWNDRGREQASGSLRQALSSIRKSLGPYSDILSADRLEVSLDKTKSLVDVDADQESVFAKLRDGRQLLEGFNKQSKLFEEWLDNENERIRLVYGMTKSKASGISLVGAIDDHQNTKPLSGQALPGISDANQEYQTPVLFTENRSIGEGLEVFIAESIRSQLGLTAVEHSHISVIDRDGRLKREVRSPGSRCIIHVSAIGSRMFALARLTREPSGEQYWSRQISFDAEDELQAIDIAASLALEATEAATKCAEDASDAAIANAMAAEALHEAFTFDPERMLHADKLLADSQMLDSHASRPALRALTKAFLWMENGDMELEHTRNEVNKLVRESLDLDPNNATALAFIADVRDLVFNDPYSALSYTTRALQINPGSGYAHASQGALELRRGDSKKALTAASRARRQLENTSLQVFALMRYCVAAMHSGDFCAAMNAAQSASVLAPTSCPPLRHLYVLRLHLGDRKGAREALELLRKLEPGFSLSMVREDAGYPAATIRSVGLDKLQDMEL